MTVQNYLIVENNIVTNNVLWDGNTDTWQPPIDSIQLIDADTYAMVWIATSVEILPPTVPSTCTTIYSLEKVLGAGDIGFTWDGTVLTTNQPKPPKPPIPPTE